MDSAIIIFIITILQNILDCHGLSLREQGRLLQTHRRRLNNPDDFRIPRRSNNFYAGMGSFIQPQEQPETQPKLGARISRTGNSMSVSYGENLYKSEEDEENIYPEYRRAIARPQNPEPILVIALLRKDKTGTPEEDRYRYYQQNDRRSPQLNIRQSRPTIFNYTEQKRAINLMELPIAHYVKDYHKIEMEIQKREAEMRQKQQNRQREEILPTSTTDSTVDYSFQSYDKFKDEMMQNQKRFRIMADEDRGVKKETLMQDYESKQNKLYNNNYESRLPDSRGPYPQASGQSQDIQFPRPQIQDAPVSRPQVPDTILVPRPQVPDKILAARPQVPDTILAPKPQAPDPPSIQLQDTETLSQNKPDQPSEDPKFGEEIYNSLPNWQAEPAPPNLAALGIKVGREDNYNLQAVLDQPPAYLTDQSSTNLADMSVERLINEYRKLEQEIVRRKEVLESYKKSLKMAESAAYSDHKKPEYNLDNYEIFQPSPSSPSSTPSPPGMPDPRDPRGLSGPPGPPDTQGLSGPPDTQGLSGRPDSSRLSGPPDTQRLSGPSDSPGLSGPPDSQGLSGRPDSPRLSGPPDTQGLPGPPDSPDSPGPPDSQGPYAYITRPTQRPVQSKQEATTEYNQQYLSDSELATLFTPPQKKSGEETATEPSQFNAEMFFKSLRSTDKTAERQTEVRVSGLKPQTGVVPYPNRKSFNQPQLDQLYVIYLLRLRSQRRRHRRKPIAAYQYAYVDLEHIGEVINQFRRLRAGPEVITVSNKPTLTLHDEPSVSSEVDDEPTPVPYNYHPEERFIDSQDAFNHIRIDPEAPDMADFMPKVVFEDHGNKWWFYHQTDYNPFRD